MQPGGGAPPGGDCAQQSARRERSASSLAVAVRGSHVWLGGGCLGTVLAGGNALDRSAAVSVAKPLLSRRPPKPPLLPVVEFSSLPGRVSA